jgi:hypothetical protein
MTHTESTLSSRDLDALYSKMCNMTVEALQFAAKMERHDSNQKNMIAIQQQKIEEQAQNIKQLTLLVEVLVAHQKDINKEITEIKESVNSKRSRPTNDDDMYKQHKKMKKQNQEQKHKI